MRLWERDTDEHEMVGGEGEGEGKGENETEEGEVFAIDIVAERSPLLAR